MVTDSRVFLPEVVPELGASTPQGNIEALHAGELWAAGYTGQGVVVATIDSGVRWTHEALRGNYRGFSSGSAAVNHDYSFWTSKSVPLTPDTVDIYGHGTHVTGTLAGSGPHSIGMAPNATWIHAKAFGYVLLPCAAACRDSGSQHCLPALARVIPISFSLRFYSHSKSSSDVLNAFLECFLGLRDIARVYGHLYVRTLYGRTLYIRDIARVYKNAG